MTWLRWLYCELIYGPWVMWQLLREWDRQNKSRGER